jgi:hypothetical protein
MSYVVHLWESPVPATLQEADRTHTALSRERVPQQPKFLQLAERLNRRFPTSASGGDDDDDDGVWTDVTLTGRSERPVFSLGIRSAAIERVLPVVVETARAIGLVVYDDAAGSIHLPSGHTIGTPLPQRSAAPSGLESGAHVRRTMIAGLSPLLEPLGFKRAYRDTELQRRFPQVIQGVQADASDRGRYFEVNWWFSIELRLPPHMKDWSWFKQSGFLIHVDALARREQVETTVGAPHQRLKVADALELQQAVNEARGICARFVVPFFSACTDFRSLHHIANELPPEQRPFSQLLTRLLVARIIGPVEYERALKDFRASEPRLVPRALEDFEAGLRRYFPDG